VRNSINCPAMITIPPGKVVQLWPCLPYKLFVGALIVPLYGLSAAPTRLAIRRRWCGFRAHVSTAANANPTIRHLVCTHTVLPHRP